MPTAATLPIFPLDGVFLWPGLLLPLHIFEPRYRDMLAFALEHDGRIAMAHPAVGHSIREEVDPPVHPVCGVGEIVQHEPFPDGRANIVLRGRTRARILEELPKDGSFRIVRAVPLPEVLPADADVDSDVASLLATFTVRTGDPEQLLSLPAQQLVDTVLAHAPISLPLKLELFSEPRVDLRLHMLLQNLPGTSHPRIDVDRGDPRTN